MGSVSSIFRSNKKKDDDASTDKKDKPAKDEAAKDASSAKDADKDEEKGESKSTTKAVGKAVQSRIVDFFGNKPPATTPKDKNAPSWRNTTVTFLSFLVFLYCFVIQVWVIARTAQAGSHSKTDSSLNTMGDNSVSASGLTTLYSSKKGKSHKSFTELPLMQSTTGLTLASTTTKRVKSPKTTTSSKSRSASKSKCNDGDDAGCSDDDKEDDSDILPWFTDRRRQVIEVSFERPLPMKTPSRVLGKRLVADYWPSPESPSPTHTPTSLSQIAVDNAGYGLSRRALNGGKAASNITAQCLYVEGSELSKHGDFAVALNILYNLWIMIFILLLLSYERKRLRLERRAHSATVIGLIQLWMATDYLSKGVEVQLMIAAVAIYMISLFNLMFGFPTTIKRREALFPYLLGRDRLHKRGPESKGQYGGPQKADKDAMFSTVKESAAHSNLTMKEAGPKDLVEPKPVSAIALNPALGIGMTEKEREKAYGELDPELQALIPGGVAHMWRAPNAWEMIRNALNPPEGSGGGSGGGGGGGSSGSERMMNALMMMQVMQMMGNMSGNMGGGGGGGGMGNGGGPGNFMMGSIVPPVVTGGMDHRGNLVGSANTGTRSDLDKFMAKMRQKGVQL